MNQNQVDSKSVSTSSPKAQLLTFQFVAVLSIWNDMRASKSWQNFHFWMKVRKAKFKFRLKKREYLRNPSRLDYQTVTDPLSVFISLLLNLVQPNLLPPHMQCSSDEDSNWSQAEGHMK